MTSSGPIGSNATLQQEHKPSMRASSRLAINYKPECITMLPATNMWLHYAPTAQNKTPKVWLLLLVLGRSNQTYSTI